MMMKVARSALSKYLKKKEIINGARLHYNKVEGDDRGW
jgi:hypothetical protein